MRTKILANILIALALPLAPTGARADSQNGAANITLGSTPTTGFTAGNLLWTDGTHAQGFGTIAQSTAYEVPAGMLNLSLPNNSAILLTKDGTQSQAFMVWTDTNTTGSFAHMLDINDYLLVYIQTVDYIDSDGSIKTRTGLYSSGHYNGGGYCNPATQCGMQIYNPTPDAPGMIGVLQDVSEGIQVRGNINETEHQYEALSYDAYYAFAVDANNRQVMWGNSLTPYSEDMFLGRRGPASIRFGAPDAASPVAQTITVQNVIQGTSNTAGVDTYLKLSAGTGAGSGGMLHIQVANAGSSGTTQNTFIDAMTIDGPSGITVYEPLYLHNVMVQVLAGAAGIGAGYQYTNGTTMFSPGNGAFEFANNGNSQYFSLSTLGAGTGAALGNGTTGDYSALLKLGNLVATAAASTVSSGQISYGGTTAAASNCGSLSGAAACVVLNIAGTTHYVPYY